MLAAWSDRGKGWTMRRAIVAAVGAAVFLAGVAAGSGIGDGATAQDRSEERIAALETRVSGNGVDIFNNRTRINVLEAKTLPGPDPAGYWLGQLYTYDRTRYEFGLVCTITPLGTDYALRCTRVDRSAIP
jgi:hypothetical protein